MINYPHYTFIKDNLESADENKVAILRRNLHGFRKDIKCSTPHLSTWRRIIAKAKEDDEDVSELEEMLEDHYKAVQLYRRAAQYLRKHE